MENVFIGSEVILGEGCKIMPFSVITGKSVIGKNTVINSFCEIVDSTIGENCTVSASGITNSQIGDNCKLLSSCIVNSEIGIFRSDESKKNCSVISSYVINSKIAAMAAVGPFAHIREGSVIGEGCRIGNFVEIKKSNIGKSAKSAHLAYIGDAQIGERSNIGCGVVFVNYDGKSKHKTSVGADCFIGSSVNLIAPLEIGDNSFIACGTTITSDLPCNSFAIGRSRPYVRKRRTKPDKEI